MAALIQVVVVLYKRSPEQCESFASLNAVLKLHPNWAKQFRILLYDNSPVSQVAADGDTASTTYVHDPANGGLAAAYNTALDHAEQQQCEWLLLLDQDTLVTAAFVGELLEVATNALEQTSVGAIVPKLMVKGQIHSPAPDFFREVRHMQGPGRSAFLEATGLQERHVVAYNSGSALRVSALRATGGFPADFWLDFLDHAVFHKLFVRGYRVYLLNARLAHDFSESDVGSVPVWRQLNVLSARTLYIKQNGNLMDRLLYRIWLLRHARSLRRSGADPQVWKKSALAALWLPDKHKR